jgi:hypothetical protein
LINGRAPDWSPSAASLALQRYEGRATGGNAVNPVWSPGSSQIAFIDDARETLNAVSVKNGRRRVIARNVDWTGGLAWQARPLGASP